MSSGMGMPESLQEQVALNENRETIYSFLARIYARELTKKDLKELAAKKDFWQSLANDPESQGTEFGEGAKALAEFTSSLQTADLDKVELELRVDYAGMFLGVWQVPAHPSESAYTNKEHLIMQLPRDKVMGIYRSMGVDKVSEFTEPEDHVALELQFMAFLCEKIGKALREGKHSQAKEFLEVQRRFLDDHLGKWVSMLVADILKAGRREFYKAVAKITEGYIEIDKELVSELIESLVRPSSEGTVSTS
jgi:TorA maturation chaperone TorD